MVAVPTPFGPQMAPIGHPLAPLWHPLGTHWHPFGTHWARANVTTKLVPFGGDVGRHDLVPNGVHNGVQVGHRGAQMSSEAPHLGATLAHFEPSGSHLGAI